MNRSIPGMKADSFSADHFLAGQLAARALLSRGHRAIAAVQGRHHGPDIALRMDGFYAELARHGVVVRPAHQIDGDFMFESGHRAATALLSLPERDFTAVFCANDVMAMGAIQRFTQLGLRVPQDISVMGYDDADIAPFTAPALTTVHVPIREVASNGCRHLLNQCYGLDLPVKRHFAPHVVWRDSLGSGPHTPVEGLFPSTSTSASTETPKPSKPRTAK